MAEKKPRTPEDMEKALAAANEALEQARKEAEEAKSAAKEAEAMMKGMSAKDTEDDGMVSFFAFKDDGKDCIIVLRPDEVRVPKPERELHKFAQHLSVRIDRPTFHLHVRPPSRTQVRPPPDDSISRQAGHEDRTPLPSPRPGVRMPA